MRAIIQIRVPGDPNKVLPSLLAARFDGNFVRSSHTVVESVDVTFGAANFTIVLVGDTPLQIFQGLDLLRQRADSASDSKTEWKITTSTMTGVSPDETSIAKVVAQAVSEVKDRIALSKQADVPDVVGRLAIERYIDERLRSLVKLIRACESQQLTTSGKYDQFLSSVSKPQEPVMR